ncbi:MAG: hypothetical protein K2X79_08860 [Burkholderiaceae bacterium]|nr:hypothetical protein [Burkholderiaceae bacterium]
MTQQADGSGPLLEFNFVSISFEDWPATLDALGRLFVVAWDRSPALVVAVTAAIMALPYYWLWMRSTTAPVERELNLRERAAWDTLDLKSKRKKKGGKK